MMIGLAMLSASTQAGLLVGAVLAEAIVLYAGYGALEGVAAPPLIEAIESS